MAGMGGIDGKELFPNRALLCSEKTAEKDQAALKPRKRTLQRSIPKKSGLGESHPGAFSTGDNPKAWLAQNPEENVEKTRNPFSHAPFRMLVQWDGGSAPASTWGSVGVPAGPGLGWDIPGAAWAFMEGGGEMGRGEVVLWVCHPCPSELWHGWDKMGLDTTPGRTERDKEPPESCGGGHWPLEWPSLPGHPTDHGMLFPCGIWPSGAGLGGMG